MCSCDKKYDMDSPEDGPKNSSKITPKMCKNEDHVSFGLPKHSEPDLKFKSDKAGLNFGWNYRGARFAKKINKNYAETAENQFTLPPRMVFIGKNLMVQNQNVFLRQKYGIDSPEHGPNKSSKITPKMWKTNDHVWYE